LLLLLRLLRLQLWRLLRLRIPRPWLALPKVLVRAHALVALRTARTGRVCIPGSVQATAAPPLRHDSRRLLLLPAQLLPSNPLLQLNLLRILLGRFCFVVA